MDTDNKLKWEAVRSSIGSDVAVFGVGRLTNMFARLSGKRIIAAIDNDTNKHGELLAEYIGSYPECFADDCTITGLNDYIAAGGDTEIPFFIASYHYGDISRQLEEAGIYNIYVIPMIDWSMAGEDMDLMAKYSREPVSDSKVVVDVGMYGGHGLYITEALLRRSDDLDIVWIIRKKVNNVPGGVRCIQEGDENRLAYELATAKIWIFDKLVPDWAVKRENQIYIQVKHWSSITLKNFYLGEEKYRRNEDKKRQLKRNTEMMDYFFVGSDFDEKTCRAGFGYNGTFVKTGSCRSDILFDDSAKKRIREKLNAQRHIALYVPTYRNEAINTELDTDSLLKSLTAAFGGEWELWIKFHPQEAYRKINTDSDYVIDMTSYPDSQELVAVSDVLITDYSSIMFEAAYLYTPVFLFAPDRERYVDGERELLLDYDTLPFDVSLTNEQLAEQICSFDEEHYRQTVREFLDGYGIHEDGRASERAADFILNLLKQ